jgi:oligosaccharide reducing-end xylanase
VGGNATGSGGATAGSGGATAGSGGAAAGSGGGVAVDCISPSPPENLFVDLLGRSEAEVNAKVDGAFEALFHGGENNTIYYSVDPDRAYILDVGNNDVRSEGMSYGMMIAVVLDKKEEFDRLWTWAKAYMYESSGPAAGYFAWRRGSSGEPLQTVTNSAPDGEEYFATALIFASQRWGDGNGIYAYSSEARALLDIMVHKGESSEAQAAGITSMFDPTAKMVVFVPNTSNGSSSFTDPSYHLPAFYEIWACFDTANGAFWKEVAAVSRGFFARVTHATTGLAPEYAGFDASPSTRAEKGDFRYDAWRVVANVMADHRFFGIDRWQSTYAERLGAFFAGQGRYNDQYTLAGTSLDTNHSAGLVAMNATLGFGLPAGDARPFVEELWNTPVPSGQYRYYNGMLYMLGLLHVSGKLRLGY